MNNFSRQKLTLQTMANTTFNANDQIVIELPDALCDMQTFWVQGNVTTAGGAAHGVYLCPVELLIDAVNIECGGVSVTNGFTDYGNLFNIFRQYTLGDKIPLRCVLQHDLTTYATTSNYTLSNAPFSINKWLGFLNSVKLLDTTILPKTRVFIRLAPNTVLAQHAGNASTTGTGDILPIIYLKSKSILRVGANKLVEAVL